VIANLRYGPGDADAGDILHAAGERERALKCGCLPRNAGDLTGLQFYDQIPSQMTDQGQPVSPARDVVHHLLHSCQLKSS
jgi:hypothetical protein